jgi:pilus assembly protein CpaC
VNNLRVPTLLAALVFAGQSFAAADRDANPANAPLQPCTSVTVDAPSQILLGKSTVVKLGTPIARMVVGGAPSGHAGKPVEVTDDKNAPGGQLQPGGTTTNGIADVDVILLSPSELFLLGKRSGSMNLVLQSADGSCLVKDLVVTIDPKTLQTKLTELMPEETGIKVSGAENALVLTGQVADAVKLDQVMTLATSYGDGKKVVNLLSIASPQQVMLEVKIAEVSKSLLDKLGASAQKVGTSGDTTFSLLSNFFSDGGGLLSAFRNSGKFALNIDGQKDDGLVRVLAEPNIMAISGQPASFLSGGRIFIPTASANLGGIPTITLTEKEFGIGVKFTPTVLEGSRVNLKMVSEVSDLQQTGSPFTTVNGVIAIMPSFTVRKADTTVQLKDGQSFVVAGLIKNNVTENIKRFPGLGEIPILGALFRSSEFKKDQTELIFVITPRLVKPLAETPRLPTDNHVEPTRRDVYYNGSLEGSSPAPSAPGRRVGSQYQIEGNVMKRLALAVLAALNAGCASMDQPVAPNYDAKFGDAVREAKRNMTINPNAGNIPDQVAGVGGVAGRNTIIRYHDSFKEPPPVVPVINIGGSLANGGGGK